MIKKLAALLLVLLLALGATSAVAEGESHLQRFWTAVFSGSP